MGFQSWLSQVPCTIQGLLKKFHHRTERPAGDIEQNNSSPEEQNNSSPEEHNNSTPESPEEHNNSSPESPEDEESSPSPNQPRLSENHRDANNQSLPSSNLPGEVEGFRVDQRVLLYKATINGDWGKMREILSCNDGRILRSSLNKARETALHVAVRARHAAIVKKLVKKEPEVLKKKDSKGNSAFCIAVGMGSIQIAKILMQKRKEVVVIRGADERTPLRIAVAAGDPDMIRFVYEHFKQYFGSLEKDELGHIFVGCIDANLFDLAYQMLTAHGDLIWQNDEQGDTALRVLARKPSAFASKNSIKLVNYLGCGFNSMQNEALELTKLICEKMSSDGNMSFEDMVDHVSSNEILFEAAKLGNDKFLAVLIDYYPDVIFKKDEYERSIFHIAVLHRHVSVFKLIHKLGLQRNVLARYTVSCPDENNEKIYYNMLHLAAKLPSLDQLSSVSGAALQMQRELLWFKEVESLTPPSQKAMRDSKHKMTPRELFTKEHEILRKAGEEWMKNTAESCMIVATLVTAVVFTVTSSLPGGNDQNTGIPMNIKNPMFHMFTVAGAVALYSSITSTLVFLSIFTSRYTEDDFLRWLPGLLAAGISALLLSSLTMMVDFAAMLFLAYGKHERVRWVPLLAMATSIIPGLVIFVFQCRVIRDLCLSTIGSRRRTYFGHPKC